PRKAVRQFRDELAARGISLIIMPIPVKPAIYPEKFSASVGQHSAPLQNASYRQFVGELERDGILVFDAALELVARKKKGIPLFLEADTHWTPAAVEQTARSLKTFIEAHVFLTPAARLPYQTRHLEITRQGDIAALLRLPESYASFPPQTVNVRQILTEFGELWQSDHAAEILVLGDSFSNIYALDAMGWGKGAGLIEQLSFELGRPLDRLVMNDNGAYATRHLLVRELSGGQDRLAGKRLVIWEFSARELSFGDWRLTRISH
ncbi:MAG: hypothetical protein WCL37_06570, partial [Chrysiogenales bacterium]